VEVPQEERGRYLNRERSLGVVVEFEIAVYLLEWNFVTALFV
jgi:hypothetical protein